MAQYIDPDLLARTYRSKVKDQVDSRGLKLKLVGFLVPGNAPSKTYAKYTELGCKGAGIEFELREVTRLDIEEKIELANADPSVHGIIVYYPVFDSGRDHYIRDLVDPSKDIEGLNSYWARKLYKNERFIDQDKKKKALLPCTPLAIVKLLSEAGIYSEGAKSLKGKTISIFNRSEVVGRPLASMLANDGAIVYSFDINGCVLVKGHDVSECSVPRKEALLKSDIIITGVPTRNFDLIKAEELKDGNVVCLNFSTVKNFSDEAQKKASYFIPRVGPMTVAMSTRNTLRLFENYHA